MGQMRLGDFSGETFEWQMDRAREVRPLVLGSRKHLCDRCSAFRELRQLVAVDGSRQRADTWDTATVIAGRVSLPAGGHLVAEHVAVRLGVLACDEGALGSAH